MEKELQLEVSKTHFLDSSHQPQVLCDPHSKQFEYLEQTVDEDEVLKVVIIGESMTINSLSLA